MGMMVAARKVAEDETHIRYEFGLDRAYDRILVIDKATWAASSEDGDFDAAAGAIAAKLKKAWREGGEFPQGAVFAS